MQIFHPPRFTLQNKSFNESLFEAAHFFVSCLHVLVLVWYTERKTPGIISNAGGLSLLFLLDEAAS